MEDFSSLDQLSKEHLIERCHHLQTLLDAQERTVTSWIEALTALTATDQSMAKPLTKGLQLMLRASQMDGGYIHLLDEKEHILRLTASSGLSKKAKEDLKIIREGEMVPGQVLQKAEALIATHVTEVSDLSGKVTEGKKRMLHAGFPLTWNGRVLGTLTVVSKDHRTLSDGDAAVLRAFSQFMATVSRTLLSLISSLRASGNGRMPSILYLTSSSFVTPIFGSSGQTRLFWTASGFPSRTQLGKNASDFCMMETLSESPVKSWKQCSGRVSPTMTRSSLLDGGGIFAIIVAPILTFGRLAGSIHVIREITQERLLEKDREELGRKVSLFAPGTIGIDSGGIIRSLDSGATEILDYQEEEIKGKPFSLICSSPETETLLEGLRDNGGILDVDATAIAKGQRPVPVSLTLLASRNQEERGEEITIFLRDMTPQQKNQMRFGQSTRLTAMMEMAANVSRKLGEKLESMEAHIDRIENGVYDSQEIATRLERVVVHARSVLEVLHQLRQFSEIRPQEKPRLLESTQLIQSIVDMIKRKWSHLFQKRGIEFEINPDQRNLPSTRGDLHELLRVFDQLIRNAVEAMPKGGKLILRTRTDRKWVTFVLIDDGVGMNPEEVNRAFEPFFTTHSQNLGLGLSIVHSIVRSHQGEVRLQSDPGQGTRVTVRLPTISETSQDTLSTPQSSLP